MLPFKIVCHSRDVSTPLKVHTVGRIAQRPMRRPNGLSAQQIYLCVQGSGTFSIKQNPPVTLSAGQGLFLPANTVHEYRPLNDRLWELAFVSFDADLPFIQGFGLVENEPLNLTSPQPLYDIVDRLWHQPHISIDDAIVSSSLIYTLLLEFNKLSGRLIVKDKSIASESAAIVTKISAFIRNHYFQDIRISELARTFGYSVQHLNRLFKARYGLTVHQYLIRVKLDQASSLMTDYPHLALAEVAGKVGMETGYFMRAFKKTNGLSARKYSRKRMMKTQLSQQETVLSNRSHL